MELPIYVYCPETRFRRRRPRPLAERLHDWISRLSGALPGGATASLGG